MADFEIVSYATYAPTSGATSRTLATPSGIQAGDMVHVFLSKTGGTAVATMTGGTGYTEETNIQASGITSQYWQKKNAGPSDGSVTLTFTTGTALRLSVIIVVTRGQKASFTSVINRAAAAVATSRTLATPTASYRTGYLAFLTATGTLTTATDYTSSPALTKIAQVNDANSAGASSALFWGGPVESGVGYGGNTLSVVGVSSAVNTAAWLVAVELEPEVIEDTVYPTSTVSNTGWTAVGAGSIHAALADSDDATYAETGDNPAGSTFTVALDELGTGDITVRTRNVATAASPVISREIALLQTSTVIATRTITLPYPTVAQHTFTLTSGELATVTNRAALRVRITDTAA